MRGRRRLLAAVVVGVTALLGASVGAEAWVRARGLGLDTTPHTGIPSVESGCVAPDLLAGYAPVPGTCGRDTLGLLPVGRAPAGDEGPRVLVLGDSISQMGGWVAALDRALRPAWPGLVVGNAGVAGYDTCQELAAWERVGAAFAPDLVVLQTCVNDLAGSAAILPLSDRRVRVYTRGGTLDLPFWAVRSQALTLLALTAVLDPATSRPDPRVQVGRCARTLRDRAAPVRVVAVNFPAFSPPEAAAPGFPSAGEAERSIAEGLAWAQVPSFDLRPVLEAAGPIEGFRSQPGDDLHPNQLGAELAGVAVANWIEVRGLTHPRR